MRGGLSFSHGCVFDEPFRERPENTWDHSHEHDIVSLGARLSKDKKGGHNQSVVSRTKVNNALNAHSLDRFQTYFM